MATKRKPVAKKATKRPVKKAAPKREKTYVEQRAEVVKKMTEQAQPVTKEETIRPTWDQIANLLDPRLQPVGAPPRICRCGLPLGDLTMLKTHWEQGHFDSKKLS